ncbi:MAG: hypothetical protein KC425_06905, partial [Anaerolineales bacterium]|nr:hypothetical protein [Anaerolineales bacterium]
RTRAAVAFVSLDDLPTAPAAWNSLDILILNDVDTGQLNGAQQTALTQWVETGGQLVVTGGPGWQKTAAALTDLLPVALSGSESVDDLPALRVAGGTPFRDPGPYVVASSSLRSGELLVHQDGLPLLARQPWGRGQVYFLALDPKLAPLVDWDGSQALWGLIAGDTPQPPYWGAGFRNGYAAGEAVSALPGLALPSALALGLFLLVYVVAVGPANYVILNRIGRRELAWLSVPALVLLFSILAYFTGFQLKGNDVVVNQMTLLHGPLGGDTVRAQTLLGLYSPRRSRYDLTLPGDALARPFERTYGAIGGAGHIDQVTRGGDLVIENVRVDVSAVETFIVNSYQPAPAIAGSATLGLAGGSVILEANVQNNGDVTLENATLLIGGRAISLGDMPPGDSASTRTAVGAAAASGGSPALAPGGFGIIPPPGSGAPLTNNAATILGTSNYYEEPVAQARYQLLSAVDESFYGGSSSVHVPGDVVTLVAWAQTPQLDARIDRDSYDSLATTLYLLEMPLTQGLVAGNNVSLPLALLNWSIFEESGVYEATPQNLFLSEAAVAFEYVPWREFQRMSVTDLTLVVLPESSQLSQPPPDLSLWDWEQALWQPVPDAGWGETVVVDYGRYLGENNAVRLRIATPTYGVQIGEVYPQLTGELD